MCDSTDRCDLSDHLTWQMSLTIDHNDISTHATAILGETFVRTVESSVNSIMNNMEAIRGNQESCECTPFTALKSTP